MATVDAVRIHAGYTRLRPPYCRTARAGRRFSSGSRVRACDSGFSRVKLDPRIAFAPSESASAGSKRVPPRTGNGFDDRQDAVPRIAEKPGLAEVRARHVGRRRRVAELVEVVALLSPR